MLETGTYIRCHNFDTIKSAIIIFYLPVQSGSGYHQMGGKGTKKSLPLTSGSCSLSSSSTAHKFRKFRTRSGGPKIAASWEIRYCEEEGSIPWEQIVQRRKLNELCDKKIKKTWDWDASSGEESLEKAKARYYWCTLNGFPCESLANDQCADMNIDKDIDWDPEIDSGMSLGLDRRYESDVIINEGRE